MYLNAKIEDYRVLGLDPVEDGGVSAEYLQWYDAAWAEEDRENKRQWAWWDLLDAIDAYLAQFCPKPPPMELIF